MTPWAGPAGRLAVRIEAFIRGHMAGSETEDFDKLALDIHRWQAGSDPCMHALTPRQANHWTEIPAVPVGLFKALPIGTASGGPTFRTSGTTGGSRGVHSLRSSALYDLGSVAWAERCLPARPREIVALLLDPGTAPDSSLSHMVQLFTRWGGTASWHQQADGLDLHGLDARLSAVEEPVFLATTAFALAEWLDHGPAPLPHGSVLMVTGGFKGRVHRLEGAELYEATLGQLAPTHLVTEYGMTELSSQLWGTPDSAFLPPPWLRAVAVDPRHGTPLPPGTSGQLRFYDLCNLDSSVGIETLDHGFVDDHGGVTLHGRLPGSPARGCSLTAEEAWLRRGSP